MARKSKPKPKTPDQIQAEKLKARKRDFEAVNLPADAAELPNHQGVVITRAGEARDSQKVEDDTARRADAFDVLRKGFVTGGYDAVRRLERAMLRQHGEGDKGRNLERVDGSPGSEIHTILAKVDAGTEVAWVLRHTGDRDALLLGELLRPKTHRPTWRDHVAYVTGETHEHAQGAAVRAAVANLVPAYKAWDELDGKAKHPRRSAWGGSERAA